MDDKFHVSDDLRLPFAYGRFSQLPGRRRPFAGGTFVGIPAGTSRLPNLGVECGSTDDDAPEASEPTLVVEILLATARGFDRNEKLEDYKTVPTLEYILLVDSDVPQIRVYRRDAARRWASEKRAGLETAVDLPLLGLRLPLSDVYAGLTFGPRATLSAIEEIKRKARANGLADEEIEAQVAAYDPERRG